MEEEAPGVLNILVSPDERDRYQHLLFLSDEPTDRGHHFETWKITGLWISLVEPGFYLNDLVPERINDD
jgi:hypothetical protein